MIFFSENKNYFEPLREKKNQLKHIIFFLCLCISTYTFSQERISKFNAAFQRLINDKDLQHATVGLLVSDAKSGEKRVEKNIQTGLAPASTQKVITATTAFELLGKNFRYETTVGYTGRISGRVLDGNIVIKGSGDPTLGSWRYGGTREEMVIGNIVKALSQAGIDEITGHVMIDESVWNGEVIPDGWIWQDIGNYYGAGARALNWRENQFDLFLSSGKEVGSEVKIAGTNPSFVQGLKLQSELKAGPAGSGDNAYIYLPMFENVGYVRGTIPANQNRFSISGAMPFPGAQLAITLEAALKKKSLAEVAINYDTDNDDLPVNVRNIYTIYSPPLDSICYWFLQKSINLYGEALLKTLGKNFGKEGSTSAGVKVVQDFWKKRGIDNYALNILDGSGLSPQNRITADDLVKVLQFAKKQPWFNEFYTCLPTIHGIKMKSGSINGVLSYTGFVDNYVFAFIINNYDGSGSAMRKKMWDLLDMLK